MVVKHVFYFSWIRNRDNIRVSAVFLDIQFSVKNIFFCLMATHEICKEGEKKGRLKTYRSSHEMQGFFSL